MPFRIILLVALMVPASAILQACDQDRTPAPSSPSQSQAASPKLVITSFYPTAYFASRIAGGLVDVRCPIPPGDDPVDWKPTAAQIGALQSADLIILNGARYENWAAAASLPLSKVIDTSRPFETEFIKFKTTTHSHGAGGAHSHTGIDGHTWMDPVLATRQAEQILSALSRRWPEHAAVFGVNYKALADELASLDSRLASLADRLKATRLLSNHPAYAYLARRYGLTIIDIAIDPGTDMSDTQWQEVQRQLSELPARSDAATIMLFESAPLPQIASRLAALNIRVVEFDPCETPRTPESAVKATYLFVMNENVDRWETTVANDLPPVERAASPAK